MRVGHGDQSLFSDRERPAIDERAGASLGLIRQRAVEGRIATVVARNRNRRSPGRHLAVG